jgi:hypothetical protein
VKINTGAPRPIVITGAGSIRARGNTASAYHLDVADSAVCPVAVLASSAVDAAAIEKAVE